MVYTYTHTCMHACMHTYIHTYKHTYIHTYIYIYIYIYIYHITEFKTVDNLGEKNRKIGKRWGDLNEEDKERYKSMAKDVPHPDTLEPNATWKETSRIITNFEANVCKYTYMLVVVYICM